MKATVISVIIALILSLAICFTSLFTVRHAIYDMEDICMQAIDAVEKGDLPQGNEEMVRLAMTWEKYAPWLEMIASHEDIHNVTECYVEASINLRCEHLDDFHKSMALLEEVLEHLQGQEPPKLSNIF